MSETTTFLVGVSVVAVAAISWAVRLVPGRAAAARPPVAVDPVVWRRCDSVRCAHLETRHDRTAAGLVCRGCGVVKGAAA
ncbi:hypothetical protein AB0H29_08245 [Streptomyces thermolilacinus]